MALRVGVYCRVSTDGQTVANQIHQLAAVAERRGWEVVEIYSDNGVSGAKGRQQRPALDRLLKDAVRGRVDMVAAWSVDRLGRSLQDLVGLLEELKAAGVGLYLHQQGLDTTTPGGRAMFQMCGVFAEFERAMIVDRVHAGLARARAQGKTLGRPRLPEAKEAAIRADLAAGKALRAVVREHGVGTSAVQRIRAEMVAGAAPAAT